MENKKLLSVFKKVKELTKNEKLFWMEEADGTTFYTSVSDYKVYIAKSAGTVSFELFNQQNDKIGLLEEGGYFNNIEGLNLFYEQIREKVINTDNGLDDLLGHLGQIQ